MNIRLVENNGTKIAIVDSDEVVVIDGQSALDLAATIDYDYSTGRVIIPKAAVCEDFFRLSTGVAGEIAQKEVE
jgi:hypothetical protein